jgi:hypothetical protein
MPPRRSAPVAAVSDDLSSALSPLPLPLVHHIFSLLPADARARAACVRRGWQRMLDEVGFWTRLDLSPASGVAVRITDAVLRGAARKARGQLSALDVSDCAHVSFKAMLDVVRANSSALRELCVGPHIRRQPSLCLLSPFPRFCAGAGAPVGQQHACNTCH